MRKVTTHGVSTSICTREARLAKMLAATNKAVVDFIAESERGKSSAAQRCHTTSRTIFILPPSRIISQTVEHPYVIQSRPASGIACNEALHQCQDRDTLQRSSQTHIICRHACSSCMLRNRVYSMGGELKTAGAMGISIRHWYQAHLQCMYNIIESNET